MMARRIPAGLLVLVLVVSATPWEMLSPVDDSSLLAPQNDSLNSVTRVSLEADGCCVCLCPFTSSPLNFFALPGGSIALPPAIEEPLFTRERSFADPPLRLVFHPPRMA